MSFQGKTFQLFLDIVEINKVYWLFTIQFFVPLKAIDYKSTYRLKLTNSSKTYGIIQIIEV